MRLFHWLTPLVDLRSQVARRASRRRVRRGVGSRKHRLPGFADIGCCERLETRLVLSGVTDAGGHVGHEHADVEIYLPTQHRLTGTSEFLTGPTAGDPFQIASDYLVSHAAELGLSSSDLAGYVVSSQY